MPPPTPTSPPSTETWTAIITAIVGAAAVAIKRKFSRKQPAGKSDLITRTEFHQGLDVMRDRVTAAYLAMGEKMDVNHRETLAALTHLADTFEARLDHLETAVARIDERTKK